MRRATVILFLLLYSMGNILLPYGDLACLHEMYQHCAAEDPDINAADFVFEHLLNVPDVFDYFEQDEDSGQEKPHQPYHFAVSSTHVVVTVSKPIGFECTTVSFDTTPVDYPVMDNGQLPAGHLSQIFHPPIV